MNVREMLWLARQISRRIRPLARERLLLAGRKMFSDLFHFDRSLRQLRKIFAGCNGIAEEKQVTRALAVRGMKGLQHAQRTGAGERYILDPVVRLRPGRCSRAQLGLWRGNNQRLEI